MRVQGRLFVIARVQDSQKVVNRTHLVVAGAVAAFCITSTTRAASDLGYTVLLPDDALIGFDIGRADGSRISARVVLDVTLALLGSDFARAMPTGAIADAIA